MTVAEHAAESADTLRVVPIGLRAANEYVVQHHRHHGSVRGHKFSVAVRDESGALRGVAIAGRPVARQLDDGHTLEVLRVCTDGAPNACSMLYGAVRRTALAMGYDGDRILTYTLATEPGTSLRAAGWHRDAETKGGEWDRLDRPRETANPDRKVRWRAAAPQLAEVSTSSGSRSGGDDRD